VSNNAIFLQTTGIEAASAPVLSTKQARALVGSVEEEFENLAFRAWDA
jgi:hypothetical protein